jgi:hypothetical protein
MIMGLDTIPGLAVYPQSVIEFGGTNYFLATGPDGKILGVDGDTQGFEGLEQDDLLLCPISAVNAAVLRERLPWLKPQTLGLSRVAGCGDRLGLATPGHVRAVRAVGGFAPIFAQQSMRENARTGRSPQEVVDDAMWGIFQEGWREPWGADADHLKTTDDIDLCLAAGYTFFTVDPGDHVDNEAHTAPIEVLAGKLHTLPWDSLADSSEGLQERYLNRSFEVENLTIKFDETSLVRAAAKYGRAIAHTVRMYRHLADRSQAFELEMSVDETDTPTSIQEHFFIASELNRLGVQWVSLAPRYIGEFEKGVDYIGDLDQFDVELAKHAAIARTLGPYKLSIHSGSDKFSIYPLFARHAGDLVHLKTAGTSYLEELRAVAKVRPVLFREILACAIERYPQDRATYHVSAELGRVPRPESVPEPDLPNLLDQFDAREVLHVTFGSALDAFGDRILDTLRENEEIHYGLLDAHFRRHLLPFLTPLESEF